MNHILPERRARTRTKISATIELHAGDARVPAELIDISFVGLRGRVAADTLNPAGLSEGTVRIDGLPAIAFHVEWTGQETFAATFVDEMAAGPIVAAFLEERDGGD